MQIHLQELAQGIKMTFRYVLKEKVDWYISRGWVIVGEFSLGGWDSYVVRRDDYKGVK